MVIGNPERLIWFLILPLFFLVQFVAYRRGRKQIIFLCGKMWFHHKRLSYRLVSFLFFFFFSLFIAFLLFSFVGLSWGTRVINYDSEGVEISFVLDVSNSMLADDIEPTRLSQSLSTIRAITHASPSLWYSLVVYKGSAVRMIPMTQDIVYLDSILSSLSPALLTAPGSNLIAGLKTGRDSFVGRSGRRQIIFVFSDFEYLPGELDSLLYTINQEGINLGLVGTASRKGSSIALSDGRFVRDANNTVVISRLNIDNVDHIMNRSNGFFVSLEEDTALKDIHDFLRLTAENTQEEVIQSREQFLLFCALLSFIISLLVAILFGKKNRNFLPEFFNEKT